MVSLTIVNIHISSRYKNGIKYCWSPRLCFISQKKTRSRISQTKRHVGIFLQAQHNFWPLPSGDNLEPSQRQWTNYNFKLPVKLHQFMAMVISYNQDTNISPSTCFVQSSFEKHKSVSEGLPIPWQGQVSRNSHTLSYNCCEIIHWER